MSGYLFWPVPSTIASRSLFDRGPGTRSYSTPMSMSAFSTRQHGWPLIFTHWLPQRWSFTVIATSLSGGEQRQVGLALAAQYLKVDCDTPEPPRVGERDGLRLEPLGGEDAAAAGLRRVAADEVQVARELLDRLDRPDPLHLDRDPAGLAVAAHEVDRPDLGLPLAPDERERLAERLGRGGERLLQVALDAVLLPRGRLAHVVLHVAQHLEQPDLEGVVALRLGHNEPVTLVGEEGRSGHPVERLVAAGVVVHEHGAVGLEDEEPDRLRQHGREPAGVGHFAAGHDEAHAAEPTVPFGHGRNLVPAVCRSDLSEPGSGMLQCRIQSARRVRLGHGWYLVPAVAVSAAFDAGAADGGLAPVLVAHPGLAFAVVVGRPDDQRRVAAADTHRLGSLLLRAAPDTDERV